MSWIMLALVVLGVAAWLVNGIRQIGAISAGEPIREQSGTALLMIDLQTVFWDASTFTQVAKAEAKTQILAEVDAARSNGIPIIAIRQEWSIPSTKAVARLLMKGQAVEGTSGTELAAPFRDVADHVTIKRVQDAFETKELDALLAQLNVGKLLIVGLDTNYCIAKTALAARQRGYDVEIVEQGVLSAAPETAKKTLVMLRGEQVIIR
ncbi:Nicotinamidase-related amidase [Octadecabacter temperatus]|uniref:Nicotinamidase/pyrazinamidase n=1 Tax=Octadecabacter temperatus TaxID=1458307 RepID=A0A0K0Y6C4_9RHOB|nr:cysteine hydrolase [Octadecabacter temperatus]AKS46465.1 nicotinamidase/pyrazinamidase [Octadecabacter temperatus]SIO14564.1 Nicotinamidase-related amidase [Octadecabacter temperatus]